MPCQHGYVQITPSDNAKGLSLMQRSKTRSATRAAVQDGTGYSKDSFTVVKKPTLIHRIRQLFNRKLAPRNLHNRNTRDFSDPAAEVLIVRCDEINAVFRYLAVRLISGFNRDAYPINKTVIRVRPLVRALDPFPPRVLRNPQRKTVLVA